MAVKNPVEIKITTSGLFFTPQVTGSIHRSIGDAMEDVSEAAASAAAGVLEVGHGVLPYSHKVWLPGGRSAVVPAGALRASIEPRFKVKAKRSPVFVAQAYVVQGARGYEPVRLYGAKINKLYRQMFRGSAAGQAYASANAHSWASRMAAWLSKG